MKTEMRQSTSINKEHVLKETLIDNFLKLGNFINANEEELNNINFLSGARTEEYCCKPFIQNIIKELEKYLVTMSYDKHSTKARLNNVVSGDAAL